MCNDWSKDNEMRASKEKNVQLQEILLGLKRVAVAYSGGIDSTFLLYSAVQTLGGENVKAYTCVSEVNAEHSLVGMRNVFAKHFAGRIDLHEVRLHPLMWKEFAVNDGNRCYFCKRRMYLALLDEVRKENYFVLVDGTNRDDLKKNRPGLRAIRELNVQTPLAEAGLTKEEIRLLARSNDLVNSDLPSNSCLATRIAQGVNITQSRMAVIEKAEKYLHQLGFNGCRVKIDGDTARIELNRNDFVSLVKDDVRISVLRKFYDLGLPKVSLDLTARSLSEVKLQKIW